nr:hypothetical transcript [Hymenolepis microstoma]
MRTIFLNARRNPVKRLWSAQRCHGWTKKSHEHSEKLEGAAVFLIVACSGHVGEHKSLRSICSDTSVARTNSDLHFCYLSRLILMCHLTHRFPFELLPISSSTLSSFASDDQAGIELDNCSDRWKCGVYKASKCGHASRTILHQSEANIDSTLGLVYSFTDHVCSNKRGSLQTLPPRHR